MKNLFEHTSAPWIRHSSYEYKTGSDNNLYITVSKDARPDMYHPMQEAEQFAINAINVGLAAMHKVPEENFKKNGVESGWSVADREGIAITMAMGNAPQAVAMELQNEYAERYGWLVKEFTDWTFTFMTSFLYYIDYDTIDEQTRSLYRQGVSAFGGISPTYRIALEKDSPVIVWDFHSLLIMVQMCFSFMLTDKDSDMRMCKHCKKAFVASRKGNEFCSQKCKNQFNVYKSREKKKVNKINP